MSSFAMDYCSTKHFDCITYYFNVKYMIEKSTIYKDISAASVEELIEFKKEYESYKPIIIRITEKMLQEKHGPECELNDIRFIELTFNEIANHACYTARISVTFPNNIARNTPKNMTFFQNLLGTVFRMRTSYNPKAGFFFKYMCLIGQQTSLDKELVWKYEHLGSSEAEDSPRETQPSVYESNTPTTVVNVKVKFLRSGDASFSKKAYDNLKEWMDDPENVYIGRRGIVFIDGERFPKKDSIWANPFKVSGKMPLRKCCKNYEEYITERIEKEDMVKELLALKGKNLGCWCKEKGDEMCHGDVLLKLIEKYSF